MHLRGTPNPQAQYQLLDTQFVTGDEITNVLLSNGLNQARLPAYHRLDIGVTRQGRFFGFADYEFQAQVINAYAKRNTWFILHRFEANNTIGQSRIPQIPIPLPNLSLSLKF